MSGPGGEGYEPDAYPCLGCGGTMRFGRPLEPGETYAHALCSGCGYLQIRTRVGLRQPSDEELTVALANPGTRAARAYLEGQWAAVRARREQEREREGDT